MRNLKVFISLSIIFISGGIASAQRFSVGTNAIDWASLGTMNIDAGVAVAQRFSIHAGAELNPWTYIPGDQEKEFQARQRSFWAGLRWWPWHVYSGWWVAGEARYSTYNLGGILKRDTEEGDAYGAGAYGGYSIMLNEWLNLDLGIGIWGGYKKYTRYACPVCGVRTEQGAKGFVLPDARVAIMFVF